MGASGSKKKSEKSKSGGKEDKSKSGVKDKSGGKEGKGKGKEPTEGEREKRRQEVEKRFLLDVSAAIAAMLQPNPVYQAGRSSRARLSTPADFPQVPNPRQAVAALKTNGTFTRQVGVLSMAWKEVGALELEMNTQVDQEVLSCLSAIATDRKLAKSVAQYEVCDKKLREVTEPRLRAKLEEKVAAHRNDVLESNKTKHSATQAALMSLLQRQLAFHHRASLNLRAAAAQLD